MLQASTDGETLRHWQALACHTPLGILTDLDGTLLPFAATPDEAKIGPDILNLTRDLSALPGVKIAVVSGRLRDSLGSMFQDASNVSLVAEHGGWSKTTGAWQAMTQGDPHALDAFLLDLQTIAGRYPGSMIERKTWSVTIHTRRVRPSERPELRIEVTLLIDAWLAGHPEFERIDGAEVVEVRPRRLRKSLAIPWMRDLCGADVRLLALGDDLTDEDMFRALGAADDSVLVNAERNRVTAARWRLRDPASTMLFLRWILEARIEGQTPQPPVLPAPIRHPRRDPTRVPPRYELLCVSNRLPNLRSAEASNGQRKRNVGGLVSALEPALAKRRGIWLGWSGNLLSGEEPGFVVVDEDGGSGRAWMDLPEIWHRKYYNGLCNRSLWPLFHSFPGHLKFAEDEWAAYEKANEAFADAALDLVGPKTPIWAHDYHLLLLARALRRRGHRGPIGAFLHIPFPGADLFSLLPWSRELLDSMLDFDLLGFHTRSYVDNFRQCVGLLSPANVSDDLILHRGRRIRIREFPIGIIPEDYQEGADDPALAEEIETLLGPRPRSRLILGVDRLDYTKGIPERLLAFGRLLELFPEWRTRVSFLQISVPSREDIPEYSEQRARVENIVGRINGEFGEANWVPIRYLYRSYGRGQLSQLFRAADVGCVTPLRDGMNLVAKEFVAAQSPENPGVLVLSSFAGAAAELTDALLTNPWYVDGMARDLDRALRMTLVERSNRHTKLLAAVTRTTAITWADDFLASLDGCRS